MVVKKIRVSCSASSTRDRAWQPFRREFQKSRYDGWPYGVFPSAFSVYDVDNLGSFICLARL